jgi:phage N-6-adenine-methyltransferase
MADFKTKFGTGKQDWETPESVFAPLNAEFGFTLDVCATAENAKCSRYFTATNDALKQPWEGVCWMNPPFGTQGTWVRKAYTERAQRNNSRVPVACSHEHELVARLRDERRSSVYQRPPEIQRG